MSLAQDHNGHSDSSSDESNAGTQKQHQKQLNDTTAAEQQPEVVGLTTNPDISAERTKTAADESTFAEEPKNNAQKIKRPLDKFAVFTIVMLSMTEGFAIGYMESLVNIFREKGVHSRQLGIVMILVWPFLIGFLGAPIVDRYYLKSVGKRKTYLLPCKLVIAIGYIILSFYIDSLVNNIEIKTIVIWIFVINLVQLFDYNALLGLRYELFGSERSDLAAFTLFCGIALGIFFSYSGFVLLNSHYFCQEILGIRSGGLINHQFILTFFALVNLFSGLCTLKIEEISDGDDSKIINTLKLAKLMLTDKVTKRPLFWMVLTSFGVMSLKSSVSLKLIQKGMRREHLVMMQGVSVAATVASNFFLKKYMQKGQILTYCARFLFVYLGLLYVDFVNVLAFDPASNYLRTIVVYLIGLFLEGLCPWGSYQMGFINSITYEKYAASYTTTMMGLLNMGRILPITLTVSILDYIWYPLFFILLNVINMGSLVYLASEAKAIDQLPEKTFHRPIQILQEESNPLEVNLVVNEKDDDIL